MSEYTKGPWTAHEKGIHPNPYVCGPAVETEHGSDKFVVAYLVGANVNANSRLIAAAPDLLAALQAVRSNLIRLAWEENSVMIEGIDKAISKALGTNITP